MATTARGWAAPCVTLPVAHPATQEAARQQQQKQATSWELSYDDVHFERKVGEGAFGEVWQARLHGKTVAAKKLKYCFPLLCAVLAF